jgi:hypothetical protein
VKRFFPILIFLTGTASAGTVTLSPVPATESVPSVVGSYAVCKDATVHVRVERLELQGHEVDVMRDCDQAHVLIALQTKAGWTLYTGGAPGSEQSSFATVKKKRALLHRTDTSTGSGDSLHVISRVDVCTYDDSIPKCGAVSVECPETGCKAPEILKGALWLHAKGGRQKFTIETK